MPELPTAAPPYRVEVRSKNRIRLGVLDLLTSLRLTARKNGVGGWEITLPKKASQASLPEKGGWITVYHQETGTQMFAGRIDGIRTVRSNEEPFEGLLRIYGPSAEKILERCLAYQVPGAEATTTPPTGGQTAAAYDRRSGAGETVIKEYVNLNAGPGALVARQRPGLVIEADQLRGASVKGSGRMHPLLEVIGPLAITAGLGFRVLFNSSDQLEFSMYVPVDRSATAKFAIAKGNLVSYEQFSEAAEVNVAIVGGGGEGVDRYFREIVDQAAIDLWGYRNEEFVDRRDTSDTVELDQTGTETTIEHGPVSGLSISTIDTENLKFVRDYYLGDKVLAEDVVDELKEVEITWNATGSASTTSTVGSKSSTGTSRMIQKLVELDRARRSNQQARR